MFNYVKESYNELVHKVTWPTFAQLQNSTVVVMVASLIFAIVILAMDISFENIMEAIYRTLAKLGRNCFCDHERNSETVVCSSYDRRQGE